MLGNCIRHRTSFIPKPYSQLCRKAHHNNKYYYYAYTEMLGEPQAPGEKDNRYIPSNDEYVPRARLQSLGAGHVAVGDELLGLVGLGR